MKEGFLFFVYLEVNPVGMRKIVLLSLFCAIMASAQALTDPLEIAKTNNPRKPKARPSLPGNIVMEFGSNLLLDAPENFSLDWFGSRNFNFYYQYEKRIGTSKFAFAPGIGLGLQRYKFSNNNTLGYTVSQAGDREVVLQAVDASFGSVKKSLLVTNYVDIPVEFRFYTNPNDVYRSFHVSIGGYIGVLYQSQTKIKNNENRIIKDQQNYDLNPLRYGASFRIGAGGFNLFGRYSFSPLFQTGKAPGGNDFTNLTVGISVIGF